MKTLKSLLLVLLCISFFNLNARVKNNVNYNTAGLKIGAAFGFPLGAMPKGATGLPLPAPSLGMFFSHKFTPKWSLQIGAEMYSLKTRFATPYSQFEYIGNVEKYIYGQETSRIDTVFLDKAFVENGLFNNRYISLPISAIYHFNKSWSLSFGAYIAYNFKKQMTGTAKDIYFGDKYNPEYSLEVEGTMPFNESDKIKDWDFGLNVGGNYELKNGINFDVRLNAGLVDFFVKEFTAPPSAYRNMILQTTIGYKIGGRSKG
ncbi:MAG: PorT family protein [Chitinophagales bacterium]|nr:PorT family protein [Chitinophagales bacterium]